MHKNIFANIFGRLWSILSNFLFIPLYISYLGFENYSIISFTLIITGAMAILDAGLSATLSREFSKLNITLSYKLRVFKTLETCYFLIALICFCLISFSANYIANNLINQSLLTNDQLSFLLKIVGFEIGFQLLIRFYIGGLLGLDKQVEANIYQVGWGVFRNAFVILVILYYPNLEFFFIWQLISTIVFTLLIRFSLTKKISGHYFLFFRPILDKKIFKQIGSFASGMLLISIVAVLNTQVDKLMISKFLDIEVLGHYTLAISLSTILIVILSPISIAVLPKFTGLYSLGKNKEASELFQKLNSLSSILVLTMMVNLIYFGKELIWIWTNNIELSILGYKYLPFTAFSLGMMSLTIIPYSIAIANGYTKLNNLLGIASLLVTIPGYWLATKYYGAIGAAFVFCCVQTLSTFIFIYIINKKFTKVSLIKLIKNIITPLFISSIVIFIINNFIYLDLTNKTLTLVVISSSILFSIISNLLITYNKSDYNLIIKTINEK